jgi:hypothetical protein
MKSLRAALCILKMAVFIFIQENMLNNIENINQ